MSSRTEGALPVAELSEEVSEEGFPFAGTALKAIVAKEKTSISERRITPILESVFIWRPYLSIIMYPLLR